MGDGRDPQTGRFANGWKGGPGSPRGATAARFRAVLMEAVTEDDLRAVASLDRVAAHIGTLSITLSASELR